jgi:cytochrome c oxidase cbb3-type subunit 2
MSADGRAHHLLVVSFGGLVEIVPLFFQKSTTEPVTGLKPYDPVRLTGRDIYIREGCYNCHSQMIRPFRAETERYGHYSVAGEFVYDHPFQWGSKRTGPDLHRVGGRYSDQWHYTHLINPRDVVPESNMPAYSWLQRWPHSVLSVFPIPTRKSPDAPKAVEGKTEIRSPDCLPAGHGTRSQADALKNGHQ